MAGKKGNTLTKTVWQYTEVLPEDAMNFLRGLAEGYGKIKNYTYKRYSGIKSFGRLTPVYDIMGEVRHSGIRTQLGLPSACFDPAVVDAVSDIKSMWARNCNSGGEQDKNASGMLSYPCSKNVFILF